MKPHAAFLALSLAIFAPACLAEDGDLTVVRDGKSVLIKEADLRRLPAVSVETTVPDQGTKKSVFRGPLLEQVLGPLPPGAQVEVQALNDFVRIIPAETIRRYRPILAHSANGRPLTYESKGPLRLIFDYSKPENEELRKRSSESLFVWYVSKIIVN